jgi:hypothetical protein
MYASEFLQKNWPNLSKVLLSGENGFIRGLVIDKLRKDWGIKDVVWATKASDLKVYGNFTVFGPARIAYILHGKVEPKEGLQYVIKISSNKITKKYKDMGFHEIVCSDFFPNQVESFCQHYLSDTGVVLPISYSKFICVSCGYDLVAITNTIKILSYLNPLYVQSLSYQDFVLMCGNLSVTDESTIINHFIDGEYSDFLNKLNDNPRLVSSVLWGIVYALIKVKETMFVAKNPTWYQRKQLACGKRMEHFGLDRVIVFTHNLAESFLLKFPQIMLELNRLIKMLKGELKVMVGIK